MIDFPTLSTKQDSSKFSVSYEDPAMRSNTEGGYVISRPRHTRRPRRKFKSGFTSMSEADRAILENFWNTVHGGSDMFNWTHPVTGEVILVRFAKAFDFKYVGIGGTHRWDVTFELDEA